MQETDTYITIKEIAEATYKDKGSKFIAYVSPVINEEEIKNILKELKTLHPKAVHHCYAFRLGTAGDLYRANDDGEPSGSAGRPILGQIDSAGLTNVLVVVVRYFGGTLLGVPGLIHAYKTATAMALEKANKITRHVEKIVDIQLDYPDLRHIQYILKSVNATIHQQNLEISCYIKAGIPLVSVEEFMNHLSQLHKVEFQFV